MFHLVSLNIAFYEVLFCVACLLPHHLRSILILLVTINCLNSLNLVDMVMRDAGGLIGVESNAKSHRCDIDRHVVNLQIPSSQSFDMLNMVVINIQLYNFSFKGTINCGS